MSLPQMKMPWTAAGRVAAKAEASDSNIGNDGDNKKSK